MKSRSGRPPARLTSISLSCQPYSPRELKVSEQASSCPGAMGRASASSVVHPQLRSVETTAVGRDDALCRWKRSTAISPECSRPKRIVSVAPCRSVLSDISMIFPRGAAPAAFLRDDGPHPAASVSSAVSAAAVAGRNRMRSLFKVVEWGGDAAPPVRRPVVR